MPPGPGAEAGSGGEGDGKPFLKEMPKREEEPGTFWRAVLEFLQTFGSFVPRQHRAASQAHSSCKAALEEGLEPLEEGKGEEAHEPRLPIQSGMAVPSRAPRLPIKYGAAALPRALRKRGCQVLEAEQGPEGAKRRRQGTARRAQEPEEQLRGPLGPLEEPLEGGAGWAVGNE